MMVVGDDPDRLLVVFWTLFEQAGSSLTLFADRNTDREIGGYLMPAGQTQIFNPLFIVMLAPMFSLMWVWLAKRGLEPTIPVKFAIGADAASASASWSLVFGTQFAGADYRVPLVVAGACVSAPLDRRALSVAGRAQR